MKRISLGAAMIVAGWAVSASAQSVPATTDASRIEAPRITLPGFEESTVVQGGEAKAQAPDQQVPAGAEKVRFTLKDLKITGNTALSEEQLRPIYAAKLNTEITLADAYGIAREITLAYRNAGYFLARAIIPPQEIEGGKFAIEIIEGQISDFEIQGELPASTRAQLQAYAKKLVSGEPANVDALERQLMLMNDVPGVQVKSVLSPSTKQDGAASITLVASIAKWQAVAGLDTYGNSYIGPERALLNVQRHGLIEGLDSVSVTGLVAPDNDEMAYGGVQLTSLIGGSGLRLNVDASHTFTSPSLPGILGAALGTQGKATQLGATLTYPLIRSRTMNWQMLGGFRLSENSTGFAQGFNALDTNDHLRIANMGTRFEAGDNWLGTNVIEVNVHQGIEAFGASKSGDAGLSRAQGDPGFTKYTLYASRLQGLAPRWSLLAAVNGQWSQDPLLVAEEFGVGGQAFGRGFDGSEITGDHGIATKLELQYLLPWTDEWLDGMQVYSFYDFGATWDRDPSVGQAVRHSLSSVGLGTRMQVFRSITGDIFFAYPLTGTIDSRALDKQDDWRVQFAVRASY
jgi:hemolysin activation/secretion protein